MPAVLVHGVPDTPYLWEPLRTQLTRTDVVTPTLPGFGTPVPAGFGATKEEYLAWLVGEVEACGEPVDIVGHDWGSILVQRLVSTRPDLVRTWCVGSGPIDTTYTWHDMAQMWQTPEVGEQVMAAMEPAALEVFLVGELGDEARAHATAARVDGTMKDCMLALYRSAVDVNIEWAAAVDTITLPGLVLWGENDAYVGPEFAHRLGKRTGARVVVFAGTGHWWPVVNAEDAARELEILWSTAG